MRRLRPRLQAAEAVLGQRAGEVTLWRRRIEGAKGATETSEEPLLVKVYVKEHKRKEHATLESLLVDFLSEEDLFFHFRSE